MRNKKHARRHRYTLNRSEFENVNPLDSLSNFSDVMLVLAVGIMLALVLRWNVPIGQVTGETNEHDGLSVTEMSGDDLSRVGDVPEGSKRVGNVYYDEKTGKYYIVEE